MIVFSGLDGAGKSTQIEMLKSYFQNKNKSVFVFWSRGGYTNGFELLKKTIRIILGKKLPKSGNSKGREKALSNQNVQKVWLNIAILDLIFYYAIYLRVQEKILGKKVICDRYVYDTFIDFKLNFPLQKFENWFVWKLLLKTALKPTHHFVVLISVDESQIRSKQKFEPFPDTAETLENRLVYYKEYLAKNGGIYINGFESKSIIKEQILSYVENNED